MNVKDSLDVKGGISCMIAEDNPVARESLRMYVQRHPGLKLTADFADALSAADIIEKNPPEVLFVDIELPDLSGIELIRRLNTKAAVIFTTAHKEYAAEAFDVDAVDYLVKPITWERFCRAVDKVLKQTKPENDLEVDSKAKTVLLKDGRKLVQLPADDLIRAESRGDYVKLFTPEKSFTVHSSIKAVEEKLFSLGFRRVHRSHLVKLSAISQLSGKAVKIGDCEVPVSDSYIQELRNELSKGSYKS